MRRMLLGTLALLVWLPTVSAQAKKPKSERVVSKPAPEIKGQEIDGKKFKLSDYRWMSIYSTPRNPQNHARDIRKPLIGARGNEEDSRMPAFRFAVIVQAAPMSHEEILDATDALGEAGCTDASI